MADDKNLEFALIGLAVGAIAAYFVMTISNQIQQLTQQLSVYNQSLLYQQQYAYAQIPQIQQSQPTVIQSVPAPKPIPKKLYNVSFDTDGFITDLTTTD